VQRRILDRLAALPAEVTKKSSISDYTWTYTNPETRSVPLAIYVFGTHRVSEAQLRSVRRALNRLEEEGAIERGDRSGLGNAYSLSR
jgi:DNA-binding transcriptional ArsR family regulator